MVAAMMTPPVRYARTPKGDIAWQTVGEGPRDLVFLGGLVSHLDAMWDFPEAARFFTRISSFCRLILFDRRGCGISEPVGAGQYPSWEEWTDEIAVVMNAAGSTQAAIYAEREAGRLALMFAAAQPERVSALILANSSARLTQAADYPCGLPPAVVEQFVRTIHQHWGTEQMAAIAMPSHVRDAEFLRAAARLQRAIATPNAAAAQYRHFFEGDARQYLPRIACPSLILHRRDAPLVSVEHARYLHEHITGSRLVEIEGSDTLFSHDNAADVLGNIEEFLTGVRAESYAERVLTTVLFMDICGSTRLAAELGDAGWRDMAARFHALVGKQLHRFRGQEVDRSGDGFFASYASPSQALRCAAALRQEAASLKLALRGGLHVGECERDGAQLRGMAVHIGARVMGEAEDGEIWTSNTVKELVTGSEFEFERRGEHRLKGVEGRWRLYRLVTNP